MYPAPFSPHRRRPFDAKILIVMDIEERSRLRRKTMEAHRARTFEEAEEWDLEYWQRRTPEERLSALVAIHRDVALVESAKNDAAPSGG
jgi:hypothetical protein